MQIETLCFSSEYANTYLVSQDGKAILIDPGYNEDDVLGSHIKKKGLTLIGVFLTHGHIDHIEGLENLENLDRVPIFMMKEDIPCLNDPYLNAAYLFGKSKTFPFVKPYPLEDEDEIKLGPFSIKAMAVPYHTKGSAGYLLEDSFFSGDALFKGSIGRDDLPGSIPSKRKESLGKIASLPPKTIVYPGHGPSTSIEDELARNPYFDLLK